MALRALVRRANKRAAFVANLASRLALLRPTDRLTPDAALLPVSGSNAVVRDENKFDLDGNLRRSRSVFSVLFDVVLRDRSDI